MLMVAGAGQRVSSTAGAARPDSQLLVSCRSSCYAQSLGTT